MKKTFVLILSVIQMIVSHAEVYTVTNNSNIGDGSLRDAIVDANALAGQDTIYFDPAVNGSAIVLSSVINITDSLIVIGNGASNTIINGGDAVQILDVSTSNVDLRLDSLTIQNGIDVPVYYNGNGTLTLNYCTIENNRSSGLAGGAIQIRSTGNGLFIDNCTFYGNRANRGGAISVQGGDITVTNSTFSSNLADGGDGGAVKIDTDVSIFINCTFHGNTASKGGALDMLSDPGSIILNCTFSGNSCTSTDGGGAINASADFEVDMANTILANNLANSVANDINVEDDFLGSYSKNIVMACTNNGSGCPTWFSIADPNLDPDGLTDNGGETQTIAVLCSSVAIDNGVAGITEDQRGQSRYMDVDIGAYEYYNSESIVVTQCDSFVVPSGDETLTNSGMYSDTIPSASGCDSIISIDLTILKPSNGTDIQTACDSITWIDGNTYSSNNNTATFSIVGGAINGCDSVVRLDLTIVNSTSGVDIRTACDSIRWIDGNTYTSSNNTATYNIVNGAASGCDSLVTLNLTINSVTSILTSVNGDSITADNSSATYTWLDCNDNFSAITGETDQSFMPSESGNYAVQLSENGCIDTSVCEAFTIAGMLENSLSELIDVYPNPTNGNLSLSLATMQEELNVVLYNPHGQLIKTKVFRNTAMINLEMDSPEGIYLLKISNKLNQQALVRVVKQ